MKISKILLLTIIFIIAFAISSFAYEESETIEINIPAQEELTFINPGNISLPNIWGNGYYYPNFNYVSTNTFSPAEHNFGFETRATTTSGGTSSAQYSVSLVKQSTGGVVAGLSNTATNQTVKADWLEVSVGHNYYFNIYNNSSTALKVYIEYYSWN